MAITGIRDHLLNLGICPNLCAFPRPLPPIDKEKEKDRESVGALRRVSGVWEGNHSQEKFDGWPEDTTRQPQPQPQPAGIEVDNQAMLFVRN